MSNLIGQSIGRYHIIEQLGEGGMATVYKAFDTRLERDVAIKIIRRSAFPPEQLERILQRFEREAKALARLSHPNILKVLDYGEHEGSPYLVLEYLPGGTLKQHLGQPMPWQEALTLMLPVSDALAYAHEHKIIHRDIKPSNILLTEKGQPLLTDFGIAKILDLEDGQTLTGTGVGIGTPEYMAPEQGMGKEVDARADIYSLGIVLYELLTGRKPYTADTPMAVVFKHITDPLPRPTQFVPDLPDGVEKLLLKALSKQTQDRYLDMESLAAAMRALLNTGTALVQMSQPVPPKPTTWSVIDQPSLDDARTRDETHLPSTAQPLYWRKYAPLGALVLLLGLALTIGLWLLNMSTQNVPTNFLPPSSATKSLMPTSTNVNLPPSKTPIPSLTPTEIFTSTPTMLPTEITDVHGVTMRLILASEFIMGSDTGAKDEQPSANVFLEDYYIDKFEVTNKLYSDCVLAGACLPPKQNYLQGPAYSTVRFVIEDMPAQTEYKVNKYFSNAAYNHYPVVFIDWAMASSYCEWREVRLPTEAEWEKSARGITGRIYPWGDDFSCKFGNFFDFSLGYNWYYSWERDRNPEKVKTWNVRTNCDGYLGTSPVGSFVDGVSEFGIHDLAGNVWEWVSSSYEPYPYDIDEAENSSSTNNLKVFRGGSFNSGLLTSTSLIRQSAPYNYSTTDLGFRCARDAEP